MKRVDANILGRFGYDLLRKQNVIKDKDKNDLSFQEIKDVLEMLKAIIRKNLNELKDDSKLNDKNVFSLVLYSSILAYVNNTDLNKYVNYSTTDEEDKTNE